MNYERIKTYIGKRYVPQFEGLWSIQKSYESLSIVLDNNENSYTSKIDVPIGVELSNEKFWVKSSNFNGYVKELEIKLNKKIETEIQTVKDQLTLKINDDITNTNIVIDKKLSDLDKKLNDTIMSSVNNLDLKLNDKIINENINLENKLNNKIKTDIESSNAIINSNISALEEKINLKIANDNATLEKKINENITTSYTKLTNETDVKIASITSEITDIKLRLEKLEKGGTL